VGLEGKVFATAAGENCPWRTVAFKSERLIEFAADAFFVTHRSSGERVFVFVVLFFFL